MRFQPKTEEELFPVFPKGDYPAEVKTAKEMVSEGGNDMIKLGLKVWGPNGVTTMVTDYLLEALAYKIRHFCREANLLPKYETGTLTAEDCLDKAVRVKLKVETSDDYPDKNAVVDYVPPKAGDSRPEPSLPVKVPEDDIPF